MRELTENLYIPTDRIMENEFEKHYLLLRQREQRMYTDEQLFHLPDISSSHPHYSEWIIRKKSSLKLKSRLELKKNHLSILEIGCGNGWLTYELSRIPGSRVVGIDINLTELQQAARVFNKNSKLKFVYGDIFSGVLNDLKFDVVVFAASIQYFPDLAETIKFALSQLHPSGELHILDSPLYKPGQVQSAKERTKAYYDSMGFPEMTSHYFHHCVNGLDPFDYEILHNPFSLKSRVLLNKNPFLWICIQKK